MGIASAFLVATIANLLINFRIVQSLIGNFLGEFAQNIIKPILFCLFMVAAIVLYKSYANSVNMINTGVEVALGALIYIGLTFRYKYTLAELKTLGKAT